MQSRPKKLSGATDCLVNDFEPDIFAKPDNGSHVEIGSYVPQCVNSVPDPCCTLHEWPLFPQPDSIVLYATAACPTPRPHTA